MKKYTFFVNGVKYSSDQLITISQLLLYFNYQSTLFIIEHNNAICHQKNWLNTRLKTDDKIEIITIVGGG